MAGTASSDGAVNSAHDSYTPLAGLIQMLNLKTGEVIFGGTGSGIFSMILMVLVAVFIAGLMVGRSPEYLGKRIEAKDIKMVMLALVVPAAANLLFSCATFIVRFPAHGYWNPPGALLANLGNAGPHGLSEILYANASAVGTNGSSFNGTERQHSMVQPDFGHRNADWALPGDCSDVGAWPGAWLARSVRQ